MIGEVLIRRKEGMEGMDKVVIGDVSPSRFVRVVKMSVHPISHRPIPIPGMGVVGGSAF